MFHRHSFKGSESTLNATIKNAHKETNITSFIQAFRQTIFVVIVLR
jgi:hypothetical protein